MNLSVKSIKVDEDQKTRFDEFQWQSRSKSQTEALKKLLDIAGIEQEEEN